MRSAAFEAAMALELVRIDAQALNRASDTTRMHFYRGFLEVLATQLSFANSRITNVCVGMTKVTATRAFNLHAPSCDATVNL